MLINLVSSPSTTNNFKTSSVSNPIMETPLKLVLFLLIPTLILIYPLLSKLISNLSYFQLIAQFLFVLGWCTLLKYVDLLFPLEKEAGEQMLKIQDNISGERTFSRKDSLTNTI